MIPQQASIKDIDFGYYVSHYISLLMRWKWYIVIVGPTAGLVIGLLMFKVIVTSPELGTKAIIGIEESPNSNMPGITQSGWDIGANCVEQITSRKFLSKIIDTLNLQFVVDEYKRSEIVSFIKMDSSALFGKYFYNVDNENDSYELLYVRTPGSLLKGTKREEEVISIGKMSSQTGIVFPGVSLLFSDSYIQSPFSFSFQIVPARYIMKYLSQVLVINPPDRRSGKNIITINSYGEDYQLITELVNTVADHYVTSNFQLKKKKLESTLQQLELQLSQIKSQLLVSERELSAYRAINPTVGLPAGNRGIFNDLVDVEESNFSLKQALNESSRLLNLFQNKEHLDQTTREALQFLVLQNNISAGVLSDELTQLELQREQLKTTYGDKHPLRIENTKKISEIRKKTYSILKRSYSDFKKRMSDQEQKKSQLTNKLKVTPAKELKLAKLTRKQEINADLYSEVMVSYNAAKVAYAALMPSFYIMDYAVAPIEPGRFKKLIQLLFVMAFAGVAMSFGPVILVDLLDKRIWDGKQLEKMLKITVLESVPSMGIKKDLKSSKDKSKQKILKKENYDLISPFLGNDVDPFYAKEAFRSLQTKIMYSMESLDNRVLAITSLESGDGKSIISSNLALALSKYKKRVLLIDGDMRRGNLHNFFKIDNNNGLTDLLKSEELINFESLGKYLKATAVPNLFILPRGAAVNEPENILNRNVKNVLKEICDTYFDFTIIDTAPLGAVTDSLMMDDIITNYLLVTLAGKTNGMKLKSLMTEFDVLKRKIIGAVVNKSDREVKNKYNAYGKYYSSKQVS